MHVDINGANSWNILYQQITELTQKYAELEQKLVELRSKAAAEVTSFLDGEIGTKLDKLSRQVARIESRLHTYHEVCTQERLSKALINYNLSQTPHLLSASYWPLLIGRPGSVSLICKLSPHRYPTSLLSPNA